VGPSRKEVPVQGDSAQKPTISNKTSFNYEDLGVICRPNYYSKLLKSVSVNTVDFGSTVRIGYIVSYILIL